MSLAEFCTSQGERGCSVHGPTQLPRQTCRRIAARERSQTRGLSCLRSPVDIALYRVDGTGPSGGYGEGRRARSTSSRHFCALGIASSISYTGTVAVARSPVALGRGGEARKTLNLLTRIRKGKGLMMTPAVIYSVPYGTVDSHMPSTISTPLLSLIHI